MDNNKQEYHRIIDLDKLLKENSHFLFGPRATGKSYLIKEQLQDKAIIIDLLDNEIYTELLAHPIALNSYIAPHVGKKKYVVIDEVQRIPELLNEVHRLIENKQYTFLLTGSSARKIKRGQANLLAGRAWSAALFPLVSAEIPKFDLNRYLLHGGLPRAYASKNPTKELQAYIKNYLYEEIQAEGLVRKIPNFSRFLFSAALSNGQMLNFEQLSSDCAVPATTIYDYYQILEDTLIGFKVEPWLNSKKRKAIKTAKFFFFDVGVVNRFKKIEQLTPYLSVYGECLEHFIAMELRAYLSYRNIDETLSYWRSQSQFEVDFVIGEQFAVEVKSAQKISDKHLKGLIALSEEKKHSKLYLVSMDPQIRQIGPVTCLPIQEFLTRMWSDALVV